MLSPVTDTRLRLFLALAAIVGVSLVRARAARWGSTANEGTMTLAGDDLVPHPDLETTRAITIGADVDDVWPWLVQMGQGRGGLYSYDRLENLVGCDIHSADRIVEEWQAVEVGSQVRLAPEMALDVAVADPPKALVLHGSGDVPTGSAAAPMTAPFDFSWAFTLHPAPEGGTRLVVRERYGYLRWWAALVVEPASVASSVMTRQMLRGIRRRSEDRVRAAPSSGSRACLPNL
jgi:hypothetical protein